MGSQSSAIFLALNVDDHAGLGRHVTVDALRAGAAGRGMMVLRHVEFGGHVTLGAKRIAVGPQLGTVRIVAIGAGDPGVMHAALQERAVLIDLAVYLPVGVIKAALEQ